jgi:hypothetical protein
LFAAADALRVSLNNKLSPVEQAETEQALTRLRESLGDEAFEAAWTEAGAWTPEQAAAYGLEATAPLAPDEIRLAQPAAVA